ncbi:MAG: saccharopine dehydrogenase C-terminal domain-containing protein [Polyangiales bacterium]
MTQKVTVLGAGMVGSAVAVDLARSGFAVTSVDARPEALAEVSARSPGVETVRADCASAAAIQRVVAGADLVVGALASSMGLPTLRAVLDARKTYVDISFMAEDAWELDAYAKERGVTAVIDCGVGPGVSNLLVGYGASQLDACESVEIYVGGLPVVRTWPYAYKAPFSPHDVLEEYTRPARLVEHGRVVVKEALSEPELMDFPEVGTLEAFNTDGLRSLAYTMKAPFMKEKTLRYPGHIELMRALRHTGLFSKEPLAVAGGTVRPLDVAAALLFPKWAYEEGEGDLTVMRVIVAGTKDGRAVRHEWELFDRYDPMTDVRSMSRTTGYAATSMVALLAAGRFKEPGVFPPELLAKEPGLVDAFLAEYDARGVRVTYRTR